MEAVEIFKALCDENRARIVCLLINRELCVCEIETILDMTQSNVSRHLNKLKSVGIVSIRKDSQWVYYRINDGFLEGHRKLFEYLSEEASKATQDIKRLEAYMKSGYTCHQIREDKTTIIKRINAFPEGETNADL